MSEAPNERETVRRHAYHALRVLEIVQETPDTRTFVMDVPDAIGEFYRYRPGQFCTVRVHLDGTDVQRCYSMSSAPATDDRLAVTVKRVPGGLMSNHLHDHIGAGDELELMPPAGVFCERAGDGALIAFCGGSGVTPVFSIVKQVLHSGTRPVRLFYANRDPESVIFDAALADLEAAHPGRLTVRRHLDSDSGYVGADDVAAFLADARAGDPSEADVYVCGPTPFMDLVEAGALAAGIPADRIAIERFANAAVLDAVRDSDLDAGRDSGRNSGAAEVGTADVPSSAHDGAEAGESTATAGTALTITIKRKRHVLEHVAGDTVLDAARRATLNPPYSCEQGNCATCMALVTEGTVTMRVNNALTPDEVAEGWILTCQSLPTSPTLTVVYDDL